MNRRELITIFGGAATWPVAARAQAMPVIGFLGGESPEQYSDRLRGFRQGLGEAGYVEGQNVAIEYRWAQGHNDRLPELAASLVRRNVSVIATGGGFPSAQAAKAATATIPIVFQVGVDPVRTGLVVSLNRPGGNLTGVNSLNGELRGKWLELMHAFVAGTTRFAFLVNPTNFRDSIALEEPARALALDVQVVNASSETEFDAVFAKLGQLQVGGLVIDADPFLQSRSEQLASLALRHRLPAIGQVREFVAAGGLMVYGGSIAQQLRQVGIYTGRILKGEKPADLPVQQATKFELVINLQTAKTLGLTVPPSLLAIADEVIE
jgi:putative tryptophan/tyrosine transport system substrate-binding protein